MSGHIQSGGSLNWCTPHWIVQGLPIVFGRSPDLDPAANPNSIVGATVNYTLPDSDGLIDPWAICGRDTKVLLNPPFGRSFMTEDRSSLVSQKDFERLSPEEQRPYTVRSVLADWIKKAVLERSTTGLEIVAILPAATDTAHYQKLIFPTANEILFIRGRVRFLLPNGKPGGPAPMATALVYWGESPLLFREAYKDRGCFR